jgi:hypothetical protein
MSGASASPTDEQQREDAWRQYYQQMGYYQPQSMGLPSPAPAPVFRTPTHPARRVPTQNSSRATPRTPVGVPKPQLGKHKAAIESNTGYDDDDEEEADVESDDSDDGYESGESSDDENPGYHPYHGFQSPGVAPWSPGGSFLPPPSPLFAGMAGFPPIMPSFGSYGAPVSPGYSPYMPPPSPVADTGSMVWSAFYAGFFAGQQSAHSSTPRATPKRAGKRRKID